MLIRSDPVLWTGRGAHPLLRNLTLPQVEESRSGGLTFVTQFNKSQSFQLAKPPLRRSFALHFEPAYFMGTSIRITTADHSDGCGNYVEN